MAGAGIFPKVQGDVIYYQDYNTIRTTVDGVLGTGSGASGYGQSLTSSAVTQGAKITEAHWDNLRADLEKCLIHQSGSASLTNVSTADKITYTLINAYKTAADTVVTNKDLVFSSTQSALGTGVSSNYATAWKTSIRHRVTLTFTSANEARAFFNLGGNIRLTASDTGSIAASKDSNWHTLIGSLGSIYYTPTNFRAGGNVVIKAQTFGTGAYAANYYQAWGELTSATTVVITAIFNDASVESGGGSAYDENVTLSITSAVDYYKSIGSITGPVPSVANTVNLGP